MFGLGMNDLRAQGERVRHASGINTCVRCKSHYFAADATREACRVHTQDAVESTHPQTNVASQLHPCCHAPVGSVGCVATQHLPLYEMKQQKSHSTVSKPEVDSTKKIDYSKVGNINVGRWSHATMNMNELVKCESGEIKSTVSSASSKPVAAASSSSSSLPPPPPTRTFPLTSIGSPVPRSGDEIMVCGQLYHTGTPVILWGDIGGYDAYRCERRYVPFEQASWAVTQHEDGENFITPNRYGLRKEGLSPEQIEAVRGGQWDLPTLQQQMKMFVLHFDQEGTSRECFRTLQDIRDLSIHFMCDLDGTIYQCVDLKERALQATIANTNSVGCEIANIGAYEVGGPNPFAEWYTTDSQGNTIITIPPQFPNNGGIHTPGFVGSPARPQPVEGWIQGQQLVQMDYTPQQYAALTKLLACFCTIFPDVPCTYPTDENGNLIREKLPDSVFANYTGIIGHYHIQLDKVDPGPAMQWDVVVGGAREIMRQVKESKMQSEEEVKDEKEAVSKQSTPQPTPSFDIEAIRKSITHLIDTVDLEVVTVKDVKRHIAKQFGQEIASNYARQIKEMAMEVVIEKKQKSVSK